MTKKFKKAINLFTFFLIIGLAAFPIFSKAGNDTKSGAMVSGKIMGDITREISHEIMPESTLNISDAPGQNILSSYFTSINIVFEKTLKSLRSCLKTHKGCNRRSIKRIMAI